MSKIVEHTSKYFTLMSKIIEHTSKYFALMSKIIEILEYTFKYFALMSKIIEIVEHTEIGEHLEKNAENQIVKHLFYTTYLLQQIIEHLELFCHCVNSQTRLIIRDTRVIYESMDQCELRLTHCGLVLPCASVDLGQYWSR